MPYSAATSRPRSSAVTIVICPGSISRWRSSSGRTPWPMLPNPIMTRRPENAACLVIRLFGGLGLRGAALEHDFLGDPAEEMVARAAFGEEIEEFVGLGNLHPAEDVGAAGEERVGQQ